MSSLSNENYAVGGTGAAIFSDAPPSGRANAPQEAMGDDYVVPGGLPSWKQPSFDDDDRVDPLKAKAGTTSGIAAPLLSRFFPDPVQQGLALAKFFYFFFFAAFGSLFPLMAVYFKQLGMDAGQCGFLIGVRPIIEYLATPFWNKMADRFQKGKILLIIAVTSYILFTVPIGFIRPPVVSCKVMNGSHYLLMVPDSRSESGAGSRPEIAIGMRRRKRDVLTPDTVDELPLALPVMAAEREAWQDPRYYSGRKPQRSKRDVSDHSWAPGYVAGTSPQVVRFVTNYNENRHNTWISPNFSHEVFEKEAVHKVFFLIMLLVIIGEFFSSPAIALADSAVITLLGEENQDKYGGQRMFGSIGWGCAMFIMGIVLDHSKLESSPCQLSDVQRNYHVCFGSFAFFMFCAMLVASQIPFKYSVVAQKNNIPMENMQPNGAPGAAKKKEQEGEQLKKMAEKTKVFAQQLRSMPEFNAVFRALANLRLLTFAVVAWIMGIGVGLIFTFLFWHLQDFGGSPTLFGIASVINHLSEMAAYCYSWRIINQYGHIKVLAAGLLCNGLRFVYISVITWPWFVLPFEFVQGITHAAVWAACCSFVAHNTDAELRPSMQGFLQGIHHGFGRFCGAVFGGFLIQSRGTTSVFLSYGIVSFAALVVFVAVNFATRNEGCQSELGPEVALGDLAPHGVPSAPMPRALSSSKLEESEAGEAEAALAQAAQGPNLNVPGAAAANNPFLQDAAYTASGQPVADPSSSGQYYGGGYSQVHSGYSSSGFGLQ